MSREVPTRPARTVLPNTVELSDTYDAERMRAELADFRARPGNAFSAASGRRVLPLRSIAGDPYRTDCGGPSVMGFQDTPWLAQLPYFREILHGFPAPVRAARLWAAGPGGKDVTLRAVKMGPPWGLCRVHLAVAGGPRARVVFFGDVHHFPLGTLWFAAAWREYALVNQDRTELVHLIVDLSYTAELGARFPEPLHQILTGSQTLRLRPVAPLPVPESCCRTFQVPESFANWERSGHLLLADAHRTGSGARPMFVPAEIGVREGMPVLSLAGRPYCALEHLGDGEFRLRGWSDERTLRVSRQPDAPVLLKLSDGGLTYQIELPTGSASSGSAKND
ncbi:hypothetical protein ACIBCO_31185 [Streptomyces violascens]|uniref:hypothetical protein n=1 Tax=Streptomyces violascens TaxID=67381 RepID=UPI0037B5B7E5